MKSPFKLNAERINPFPSLVPHFTQILPYNIVLNFPVVG